MPTECDLGSSQKSNFLRREVYLQYLLSVQSQKLLNQSKEYFFDGRRPSLDRNTSGMNPLEISQEF